MTITVACDMCGKDYHVSDAMAGKNMPCKDCGAKIKVPSAGGKSRSDDDDEEVINRPPPRSSATIRTHRVTRGHSGGGAIKLNPNLKTLGIAGGVILAVLVVGTIISGGGGGAPTPPVIQPADPNQVNAAGNPLAGNTFNLGGGAAVAPRKTTTPKPDPTAKPSVTPSNTAKTPDKTPSPGTNLSVKPSAAETPTTPGWSVLPDPIPAGWAVTEVSPTFNLKVLGEPSDLKFADAHSPFILMNFKRSAKPGFEVWNLKDEMRVGGGPVSDEIGIKTAFSGDGQHIAYTLLRAANRVRVISATDGKTVNEIETDIPGATMQYLEFGPTGFLITFTMGTGPDQKRFSRLRGIEFATGELKWELSEPNVFNPNQLALSPMRKYVMSIADHRVTGKLIDLETGTLAGEFTLPEVDDLGKPFNYEAAGFSPDGTKLAVLQASVGSSGVTVLDIITGKLGDPILLPGRMADAFPDALQYDGPKIEWLPDQSGWILGGLAMLDAATSRILWLADLEHDPQYPPLHNSFWRRWIPEGFILVEGSRRACKLKFVPTNWSELRELAAQVGGESDEALISPGKSVSLKVEIGELRGGNKELTEAALIQALTARLDRDGLMIEEDQPVVLRAKYREATGNTLQETGRPPGRPRQDSSSSGKAVDATRALLEFGITDATGKTVYWADSMVIDPTFLMVKGEANSANARQAMFEGLLNRLAGLPLPFYLTKNKKGPMLPAVYKIPYKE